MYPLTGQFRRELYPKHLSHFSAGKEHNERLLLGGNRSGKTVAGAYETTAHLTGLYPDWWEGKKFNTPTNGWAAGDTSKTVRDILQKELLGEPGNERSLGTGMLPADSIRNFTTKAGIANAVETVFVKHVSGGISTLQLKSYDQGRIAFQGTAQHFVWADEEIEDDLYLECLLRTMTLNGICYITATPLLGLTPLMLSFLPHMAPASDKELEVSLTEEYLV